MATRPPVVPPPDGDLEPASDWNGIANTIGAILNPLARQQADVQKHAIDADVEKYRIATAANERYARRRFYGGLILALIAAAGIAGLFIAGQPEFARTVLTFLGGAASGVGLSKAIQRVR